MRSTGAINKVAAASTTTQPMLHLSHGNRMDNYRTKDNDFPSDSSLPMIGVHMHHPPKDTSKHFGELNIQNKAKQLQTHLTMVKVHATLPKTVLTFGTVSSINNSVSHESVILIHSFSNRTEKYKIICWQLRQVPQQLCCDKQCLNEHNSTAMNVAMCVQNSIRCQKSPTSFQLLFLNEAYTLTL